MAGVLVPVRAARAQAWAPWDAPDSTLARTLAADRVDPNRFEARWNALFVAGLRARGVHADSARVLERLARRVAASEPAALGSHVAGDALRLRERWSRGDCALRVRAAVRESLAVAARAGRNFDRADSLYRSAIDDYDRIGERRRVAWLLGGRGAMWLQQGDNDRALSIYGEALAARRALGDPRLLGNTLNDLGQTLFQLGHFAEAARDLGDAAALRDRPDQRSVLANTLTFMGLALTRLDRPDSARACLRCNRAERSHRRHLAIAGGGDQLRRSAGLSRRRRGDGRVEASARPGVDPR